MLDQGYTELPRSGDLRDLIMRRYQEGAVVTVAPEDSLLTAYQRMRMADISQLPVIEGGRPVGILDESDVLLAVQESEERFRNPVRTAMTARLRTLPPSASLADVNRVLDEGLVALIMDSEQFIGLITRTDLLNFMRRRLK
jgi:cystathionine beta-synthase